MLSLDWPAYFRMQLHALAPVPQLLPPDTVCQVGQYFRFSLVVSVPYGDETARNVGTL